MNRRLLQTSYWRICGIRAPFVLCVIKYNFNSPQATSRIMYPENLASDCSKVYIYPSQDTKYVFKVQWVSYRKKIITLYFLITSQYYLRTFSQIFKMILLKTLIFAF